MTMPEGGAESGHGGQPRAQTAGAPPSPERLRVPAVDGFRAYAAITVVLVHVIYFAGRPPLDQGILRSLLVSGYMGVDFFFVISGFVLFLPAVTNGGSLGSRRSYGERRAARILPAYYVMLAVIIALHPFLVAAADLPHTSWRGFVSLLLHLTFLHHTVGEVLGLPMGFAVNNAVWTLSIEAMFYVLLPVVAGRYFRRPLVGLVVAFGLGRLWEAFATSEILVFAVGSKPYDLRVPAVMQLPTYFGHFAAGMTAAWLFVKLRDRPHRLVPWLAVPAQAVSLAVIVLVMRGAGTRDLVRGGHPYTDGLGNWHFEHWTHTGRVGLAFAVLLLATAVAPRWAQWPVTNPVARRLGDVSYGIYLWHLPMIMFAFTTLGFAAYTDAAFFKLLGFTLAGSIAFATLSYLLVERPCIQWARRRSRARRLRPEPVLAVRDVELSTQPA